MIAKEFDLGAQDGFQFNISVGYDLAGIKEPKVNTFIDSMMEAKDTEIFKECKQWLLDNVDKFEKVTKEDIEAIPSDICNSATISTLHGCPPNEIESIANHLFKEKHLNTFIKCNPTLLGYEFARKTMDDMGYDYMVFGDFHFKDDLQYEDAIPMFKMLQEMNFQAKKCICPENLFSRYPFLLLPDFPGNLTENSVSLIQAVLITIISTVSSDVVYGL